MVDDMFFELVVVFDRCFDLFGFLVAKWTAPANFRVVRSVCGSRRVRACGVRCVAGPEGEDLEKGKE